MLNLWNPWRTLDSEDYSQCSTVYQEGARGWEYYMTTPLLGHGYSRSYLHRMGKAKCPDCVYYPGVTVRQSILASPGGRWNEEIGQFYTESLVESLHREENALNWVVNFHEVILKANYQTNSRSAPFPNNWRASIDNVSNGFRIVFSEKRGVSSL